MQKTEQRRRKTLPKAVSVSAPPEKPAGIPTDKLPNLLDGWQLDCRARSHTRPSLDANRAVVEQLIWFLNLRGYDCLSAFELRQYLVYLREGHTLPGGRWGDPRLITPLRPATIKDYFSRVRTFLRWLVAEGMLAVAPTETMRAPIARADDIVPFTPDQEAALKAQARRTDHPQRDYAIVLLLLDTGMRVSELCALRVRDLDHMQKSVIVLGKGNKYRTVYFGSRTSRALWTYLQERPRSAYEALFLADRGVEAGRGLTRSGAFQLIQRLGQRAGIEQVRCSPHTCRHTFAINYLRRGGKELELMRLLGHTRLSMTSRYVQFAQADLQNQYRSPVDAQEDGRTTFGRQAKRAAQSQPVPLTPAEMARGAVGKKTKKKEEAASVILGRPNKITRAKLAEGQVREIKAVLGAAKAAGQRAPIGDLSARFGVARSTIKDISMGYTWGHIQ